MASRLHVGVGIALSLFTLTLQASAALPCASGATNSGKVFRVTGSDHELRAAPSADSARLINEKASGILKTTVYRSIDNSTKVLEECRQGAFSRVRVVDPEWIAQTHVGWVASSVLREQDVGTDGVETFTEADFLWDSKTSRHKKLVVTAVNKIHSENPHCKDIDPTSASLSGARSTPKKPVFYVACGTGPKAFNVFFSAADLQEGKKFAAAQHIDRAKAVELCESQVRRQATHPSTVKFSRFLDLAVDEHPNGRTMVSSTFTARNSFNLELKYQVNCLLDSSGLMDVTLHEAQR
jgi:hypothetical protein